MRQSVPWDVLVDIKLNMSQPHALAAKVANGTLSCIRMMLPAGLKEVILLLFSALVRPRMECWVQLWAPQYRTAQTYWRKSQRATKMMTRLEHLSCEERLRKLGLFSLEKKWFKRDLINIYKYLRGGCKEDI